LAEVIKAQQIVHTLEDVGGSLIGFRSPQAPSTCRLALPLFVYRWDVLGLTAGAHAIQGGRTPALDPQRRGLRMGRARWRRPGRRSRLLRRTEILGRPQFRYCPPSRGSI
jgi:hypothetical protein